jgi:hypothetical protein
MHQSNGRLTDHVMLCVVEFEICPMPNSFGSGNTKLRHIIELTLILVVEMKWDEDLRRDRLFLFGERKALSLLHS